MNTPTPSPWLARTFWLPATLLIAVEVYASNFDGWGAWATAPLFLVPLVLSFGIAAAGVLHCIRESRARSLRIASIIFTFVAAAPLVWLLVRRHIV